MAGTRRRAGQQRVRPQSQRFARYRPVIHHVIVLIFRIGLFPKPFLDRIEPTTQVLLQRLAKAGATHWLAETPSDHAVAAAHVPPASGE